MLVPKLIPGSVTGTSGRRAGIFGLLALALAGCGSSSTSAAAGCGANAPTLVAAGSGQVTETPNQMTIVAGVDVTDGTAQAALADDAARSQAVIAALHHNGVVDDDIQTSGLSIEPQFAPKSLVITGYNVTNQVTATVDNLANDGAVIDAVASAAGDAIRLDGVTFSESDPEAGDSAARADAVDTARADARAMATAANETLGEVCSMTDAQAQAQLPTATYATGQAALGANTPVEPGMTQTTAQVDMTFSISRPAAASPKVSS